MIADDRLALRRWMTAELGGLQDEADQLFGAVALEMPREPAPPAVLRRVEERLGWDVQPATHRPRARARRLAVAAALALAGVGFVVYGAVALAPLIASQLLSLLNFSTQGFVWLVRALDSGLDTGTILVRAGRALSRAIAAPRVTVGFVAVELVGVAALYALHRILRLDRETLR